MTFLDPWNKLFIHHGIVAFPFPFKQQEYIGYILFVQVFLSSEEK